MTDKSDKKGKNEKNKKARPWVLDPSAFQPLPRAGFLKRHIVDPARSLAKYVLYALVFSYPVLLVSLGIVFGGLVFWTGLVGSVIVIWLIIKKAGYARNFESWGVGNQRMLGLFIAFGISLAFVYGFIHLQQWFLPIFGGVLVIALLAGVRFSGR